MRFFKAGAALATLVLSTTSVLAADVTILKSSDVPAWRPVIDALRRAASSHAITELDFKNDRSEGERLLAGLSARPMILVGMGALAVKLAHQLRPGSPLVFCMIADPEAEGLVVAPGLAGVGFETPIRNQLAAFRQLYPRVDRLGVLHTEATAKLVQRAEQSAQLLRIILVARSVTADAEIEPALRELLGGDSPIDALWIPRDPLLLREETRRLLLAETLKQGKPVYASDPSLVEEGALASDSPLYSSIGEQVGGVVNRIAAGEKTMIDLQEPLPELSINLKVAAKLKLKLPQNLLKPPTRVVRE